MTVLHQEKSLGDFYKLVSTPTLAHRYQVIRPDGLPEISLTLFANDLLKSLSSSSVPQYMREILAVVNWAATDHVVVKNGWNLLGTPETVRNLLREYLTVGAQCKLTSRPDLTGLKFTYINGTSGTRINVRTLLSALKRLYDFLITNRWYSNRNPLVHEDVARVRAELWGKYRQSVLAIRGRDPMPAASGVDERCDIRLSENYFRYIEKQWVPKTIDDPEFPNLVYAAGKRFGWGLRELCVSRTLFESGARISEIVGLTAHDWARSDFRNLFRAFNKGSHGLRTKTLMISEPTAKLLRRYFDDDVEGRRANDLQRMRVSDLTTFCRRDPKVLTEIPLFLTERGTPLCARLFREQSWKPALEAAGIDADPHQTRHWFVTNALRNIDRTSKNDGERMRRRQELIQYMSWRAGERTLKAYDHLQRHTEFRRLLHTVHREMQRRERCPSRTLDRPVPSVRSSNGGVDSNLSHDLAFLLGEDNDD